MRKGIPQDAWPVSAAIRNLNGGALHGFLTNGAVLDVNQALEIADTMQKEFRKKFLAQSQGNTYLKDNIELFYGTVERAYQSTVSAIHAFASAPAASPSSYLFYDADRSGGSGSGCGSNDCDEGI